MNRVTELTLHSFLEAASQGILAVDSDGRIQLLNRRAEEMFGYRREELLGQPLEVLLPERYRVAHTAHRAGYFAAPQLRAMGAGLELAARRKDGSEFPIEIGLSFVDAPGGKLALGLVSDISERRKAADELAQAARDLSAREAQLRSYLEAAPQAILAVKEDGSIALVNRQTEELFGYARQELLGQSLNLLIPARSHEVHGGHLADYFRSPDLRAMGKGRNLAGRRKDGREFPVEVGLSFIDTAEGRLALGMVTDIEKRTLAETELARRNDELRRTNAELEQFTYVVSHDLQEPLRMITNYLQLLERRAAGKLDEDTLEFLHYAVEGAARMKILIQDLLRFSRAGTQKVELRLVEAEAVVESAKLNLRAALEESGAEIACSALPPLAADPGLLTQVLQNLLGNAIKFHRPGERPHIHISATREGGDWRFAVRDNGIGIEPQHLQRIFQIFERLNGSEEYAGSGVGLAISQRIVERHGGRIWVESTVGQGSVFYFTIPAKVPLPLAASG